MENFAPIIILLGMVAMFTAIFRAAKKLEQRRRVESQRLEQFAALNHWVLERPADSKNFSLKGLLPNGRSFVASYDADQGSDSPTPKLIFVLPEIRTERLTLLVQDQRVMNIFRSPLMGKMMQGLANAAAKRVPESNLAVEMAMDWSNAEIVDLPYSFAKLAYFAERPVLAKPLGDSQFIAHLEHVTTTFKSSSSGLVIRQNTHGLSFEVPVDFPSPEQLKVLMDASQAWLAA